MSAEQDRPSHQSDSGSGELRPVETVLSIPGLRPGSVDSRVRLVIGGSLPQWEVEKRMVPDNLNEQIDKVAVAIAERPWIDDLIKDIEGGRRSAVYKVSLGAIVILVAGVAGYEFGIREGRDFHNLYERVKPVVGFYRRLMKSEKEKSKK